MLKLKEIQAITTADFIEQKDEFILTACVSPKNNQLESMQAFDRFFTAEQGRSGNCSFIKTEKCILLIFYFQEMPEKDFSFLDYIKNKFSDWDIDFEQFNSGLCNQFMSSENLKDSVKKALGAESICKFQNKSFLNYTNLGVYKYALAVVQSQGFETEIWSRLKVIQDYDRKHDSALLKTIVSYVKNNGDYILTAEECYQHTNTIRYRVKKAEELLGIDGETADEELFFLIRCYLVNYYMLKTA